jgi:hypothetical protein
MADIINTATGETIGQVPDGYCVSPMFDDTLYDPTKDQTVTGWGTQYDIAENRVQHGIDQTGGVAAFASVRAPAWHNLGVTFDHQVTAEELLVAAHADYDVLKVPDYAHHEVPVLGANGQPIMMPDVNGERTPMMMTQHVEDPNVRKLIRQHPVTKQWQVLGTCGPNYQVVTNREAFLGFGDAIVDVAEPNAAACGVLFEGKQAFMCWKLPKDVLVGGVDASQLWMLVRTSHDLSTPLTGAITLLRTVCQNTANWNRPHRPEAVLLVRRRVGAHRQRAGRDAHDAQGLRADRHRELRPRRGAQRQGAGELGQEARQADDPAHPGRHPGQRTQHRVGRSPDHHRVLRLGDQGRREGHRAERRRVPVLALAGRREVGHHTEGERAADLRRLCRREAGSLTL